MQVEYVLRNTRNCGRFLKRQRTLKNIKHFSKHGFWEKNKFRTSFRNFEFMKKEKETENEKERKQGKAVKK